MRAPNPVTRTPQVLLALCLVACANTSTDKADTAVKDEPELAANPPGAHLEIAFKGDKAVFRQGELIEVEMRFSSDKADTYRLDGATYDRSGRLDIDAYILTPGEGAVDPLADYFESGAMMGGGLRSMPVLGESPHLIVRQLNEHLRFDKVGRYSLKVSSGRLEFEDPATLETVRGAPLVSNTLSFEVVAADAAWAQRTLEEALAAIEAAESDGARAQALLTLRYLGTEASTRALARFFDGGGRDWGAMFGLIGTPRREVAIEAMAARLKDPEAPIPMMFLRTLALIDMKSSHPERLAPWPGTEDPAASQAWQALSAARQARIDARLRHHTAELVKHLPSKTPSARAVSAVTAIELVWAWASQPDPPDMTPFEALDDAIVSTFTDLPQDLQNRMLAHRWTRIATPKLLPHLRAIFHNTQAPPHIRAVALKRLFELAPTEGRGLILDAIRDRNLDLGYTAMDTLGALPDAELPSLDAALTARLRAALAGRGSADVAAALVDRYASIGALAEVKAIYGGISSRTISLETHAAMLATILRRDPGAGPAAIAALGSEAPVYRVQLFEKVLARHHSPPVQAALVTLLEDESLAVVAALGHHGDPRAAAPLWKRLEAFRATWADKAGELRHRPAAPNPSEEAIQLETALWGALANAGAWVLTSDEAARLVGLCVTEREREQARLSATDLDHPVGVSFGLYESGEFRASVGRFTQRLDTPQRAASKMAQFPSGTRFSLTFFPTTPQAHRSAWREVIDAAVKGRGLVVE